MSFLRGIFGKDPEKELERAAHLLEAGDSEKALSVARKIAKKGAGPVREKAEHLVERGMDALAADYLRRAHRAQEIGAWPDVIEWTTASLPFIRDQSQKLKLETQIENWRRHGFPEPEPEPETFSEDPLPEPVAEEAEEEVDPETHYLALIGMLEEKWSDHYESLPESFQAAYIAMNTGMVPEAKSHLDQLIESETTDPAYRLERARCALMLDKPGEAVADLEAVWTFFGDEILDSAGSLSVPGLWADALLRLKQHDRVIEKLKDLTGPENRSANLALYFGLALEMAKQWEEAAVFLARSGRKFEGNPLFPFTLARVLNSLGDWEQAAEFLEKSIAPSCASGICGATPKHLPSFRLLAEIYLGKGLHLKRVRELLNHIAQALNGALTADDQALFAAYYRETGDIQAAERAERARKDLLESQDQSQEQSQNQTMANQQ